jgi:hypothetical protein
MDITGFILSSSIGIILGSYIAWKAFRNKDFWDLKKFAQTTAAVILVNVIVMVVPVLWTKGEILQDKDLGLFYSLIITSMLVASTRLISLNRS